MDEIPRKRARLVLEPASVTDTDPRASADLRRGGFQRPVVPPVPTRPAPRVEADDSTYFVSLFRNIPLVQISTSVILYIFHTLIKKSSDFCLRKFNSEVMTDIQYIKKRKDEDVYLYENTPILRISYLPACIPVTRTVLFLYCFHKTSLQYLFEYSRMKRDLDVFQCCTDIDVDTVPDDILTPPFLFDTDEEFLFEFVPILFRFPLMMQSMYSLVCSVQVQPQDFEKYFLKVEQWYQTNFFAVNTNRHLTAFDKNIHFDQMKYLSNSFGHLFDCLPHYILFLSDPSDQTSLKSATALRNTPCYHFLPKFFRDATLLPRFNAMSVDPDYKSTLSYNKKGHRRESNIPEAFTDIYEAYGSSFDLKNDRDRINFAIHAAIYFVGIFLDDNGTFSLPIFCLDNVFFRHVQALHSYMISRDIIPFSMTPYKNRLVLPVLNPKYSISFHGNHAIHQLSVKELPSVVDSSFYRARMAEYLDSKLDAHFVLVSQKLGSSSEDARKARINALFDSLQDDLNRARDSALRSNSCLPSLRSLRSRDPFLSDFSRRTESMMYSFQSVNYLLLSNDGIHVNPKMGTTLRSVQNSSSLQLVDVTTTTYDFHSHVFDQYVTQTMSSFEASDRENPFLIRELLRQWNKNPDFLGHHSKNSPDMLVQTLCRSFELDDTTGSQLVPRTGQDLQGTEVIVLRRSVNLLNVDTKLTEFCTPENFSLCDCYGHFLERRGKSDVSTRVLFSNLCRILGSFGFHRQLISKFIPVFNNVYNSLWEKEIKRIHLIPHTCDLPNDALTKKIIALDSLLAIDLLTSDDLYAMNSLVVDYFQAKDRLLKSSFNARLGNFRAS